MPTKEVNNCVVASLLLQMETTSKAQEATQTISNVKQKVTTFASVAKTCTYLYEQVNLPIYAVNLYLYK